MKVLFVTGLTGFGIGGARTEEIRLVRGAADRGLQVAMCSDVLSADLAAIRHYRLDYPPAEKAPQQLADAVSDFQPHIVHVVGGGVRFLQDCDQALKSVPWVFTAHNVPPAERIFPRLYGSTRLHYAVRNALAMPNVWSWAKYLKSASFGAAVCHSVTVGNRLKAVGCPPAKVSQVPFGSELPTSALARDPGVASVFTANAWPKVLMIAGLAFHKAQMDVVRLTAQLRGAYPNISVRLIGMTRDKRYRAYVEKRIAALGLGERVGIVHSAPESVKFAALHDADLYIQPSHEEGFCIAFLEAAMLSPRLIGADTGAIAAIGKDDAMIRIVRPGDISAMASAARELLELQPSPAQLADRRGKLGVRYSWSAYLDAHVRLYENVIARRKTP